MNAKHARERATRNAQASVEAAIKRAIKAGHQSVRVEGTLPDEVSTVLAERGYCVLAINPIYTIIDWSNA